nr:reverse transcriptase domain-containing protein [Tanacetum cinerariifolium]
MNNNHNHEPPSQNNNGPPLMVRPNGQAPRTMEELCQTSINGRGGQIAPIPIQATDFGLHHHMIQQVQNTCQFHGLPGDDANRDIDKLLEITQHMEQNGVSDDALRLSLFPYSLTHHAIACQGKACPTDSSFVADQDRVNIAKTSTLPHESTSRVTSLAADEAQALENTELKVRVKFLEDRQGEGINLSEDDAPIKGRRLDEKEVATERVSSDSEEIRLDEGEVAAEKVSDDTEEMATVLITMDAASVLSSRGVQVVPIAAAVAPANVSISTGSRVVPTPSTTISTATPIFATTTIVTPYTRRKGKEKYTQEEEEITRAD